MGQPYFTAVFQGVGICFSWECCLMQHRKYGVARDGEWWTFYLLIFFRSRSPACHCQNRPSLPFPFCIPKIKAITRVKWLIIFDQPAFSWNKGDQTSLQPYLLCIFGWFRPHFPRTNAESKALSATPLAIYLGMHNPVICLGVEKQRHHCQLWWKKILEKTCRNICLYINIYLNTYLETILKT